MRIETSAGKTYPIRMMSEMIRDKNKAMIVLDGTITFSKAESEFNGLKYIKLFREKKSASYEMYEGFSRLVDVNLEEEDARLILKKP